MFTDDELLEMYHLKNVIRYSTRTKLKQESVAEHSFYVALISLKICDMLESAGYITKTTTRKCLTKAILHDMPESELNDITHDVKTKLNLYSYLEKYENEYFDRHFPKHTKLMKNKDEDFVNVIVEYADILSVKQYVLNEIQLGNNAYEIKNILLHTNSRIIECNTRLQKLLEEQK